MMEMTLRYARGISYSQLYEEETGNFDELICGLPTCESVMWLSFLVHQKISLLVGQTEYNIMGPLLFQFDADLQHRIINFMGPVGYKTDQFFDIQSLLTTITRLLEFRNQMRKELTKEDKTRLFKAYLIICDEYLEQKGLISQTGDYTAEDMLRYYMPFALKLNTVLSIKDPLIELIKSKLFLVDFASVDQQVSEYVDAYVSEKKCCSTSYYMLLLFNLSSKLINNEHRTNVIRLASDDKRFLCDFLDNFCINMANDTNAVNIQEKPLYKVDVDTYCVLYVKFFVDKFFHSMLFDIAKVCEKKGLINAVKRPAYVQLKQLVGQKFTEQYLFYRVIDKILADYKYQKMTGDEMLKLGQGLPDYYARKARRVFLFEFKDVQLKNEIVKSGNYDTIITEIENAFVKSDKGRPKGVTQLANDIESHLREMVGENFESQTLSVYPVLVYTDSSLDIEGFNYYLNNRFREILSHRKINSNIVVKDLVMVNVDTLIMFEKAFTDKKVKFDVLLNEYIAYKESKEQNRVVPFNKYLFQKCKQKGYFYKASYIVRDVIDEMIAREKQQVSKA